MRVQAGWNMYTYYMKLIVIMEFRFGGSMLNILVINTAKLGYNGITNVILHYFENMDCRYYQIDIVAMNEVEEQLRNKFINININIHVLPKKQDHVLSYRKALENLLKEHSYNIIHVHGNSATMVLELSLAKKYQIPIRIAHCHNTQCNHRWLHELLKPYFKMTYTKALSCSKEAGAWIFPNGKYEVLPNGIYLNKYKFDDKIRQKVRKELVLENKLVVGHIGLMNPQKNHKKLIEIVYEMKKLDNNVHLLCITGSNKIPKKLENKINKYFLKDHVTVLYKRYDVYRLLQAVDVFLFPSRWEGLGIVLIEAQASGLNCVVSDIVPKEVNVTKKICFVPLSEDSSKWAEICLEKARNTDRNTLCSLMILEESDFNIKKDIKLLKNIYENC